MKENYRKSEKGSAGVKLVFFLVFLGLIGNAGYYFVPAVYNGENLRQDLQAAVLQGITVPPTSGTPVEVTKKRLLYLIKINDIPPNAYSEVKQSDGVLQVRMAYNKQIPIIPFGIYDYNYQFDYTANSRGFVTKR